MAAEKLIESNCRENAGRVWRFFLYDKKTLQKVLTRKLVGGFEMNKNEILERSRMEKNDEYEIKTFKDGQTIGIISVFVICF